jgi:hypothetical protein
MTEIQERDHVDQVHQNAQASVGRRPGTSKVIIVDVRESEEECDADHQRIVVNGHVYESSRTIADQRHPHHAGDWLGWTESEIRALLESCKFGEPAEPEEKEARREEVWRDRMAARSILDVHANESWRSRGFTSFQDFCCKKLGWPLEEFAELLAEVTRVASRK